MKSAGNNSQSSCDINSLLGLFRSIKRFLACLLLFFSLIIGGEVCAEDDDLEMIWALEPTYVFIAPAKGSLDDYQVVINERKLAPGQYMLHQYKNSLHFILPLKKMENSLTINFKEEILHKASVFYAPLYEVEIVPEEALQEFFHSAKKEKMCRDCHRFEITEADIHPAKPEESLCYSCHAHEFQGFASSHTIADQKWQCLECHDPEPAELPYLPGMELRFTVPNADMIGELCYRCHKKEEQQVADQDHIHGPMAMKACGMCHNPHGSSENDLLHKPVTQLCVDCHDAGRMLNDPVVHKVLLTKKGCTACHEPHSSNHQYQLKKEVTPLCLSCHEAFKQLQNNHPIARHPTSGPKNPAIPTQKFTCTSCHNPHSGQYENLLPEEEMMLLCTKCHPMGS